jgi:hypothetical protein
MEITKHFLAHATGGRRWKNRICDSIKEDEDEEDKNRSVCHNLARRIHGLIPCQTSAGPAKRWMIELRRGDIKFQASKWGSACIWVCGGEFGTAVVVEKR